MVFDCLKQAFSFIRNDYILLSPFICSNLLVNILSNFNTSMSDVNVNSETGISMILDMLPFVIVFFALDIVMTLLLLLMGQTQLYNKKLYYNFIDILSRLKQLFPYLFILYCSLFVPFILLMVLGNIIFSFSDFIVMIFSVICIIPVILYYQFLPCSIILKRYSFKDQFKRLFFIFYENPRVFSRWFFVFFMFWFIQLYLSVLVVYVENMFFYTVISVFSGMVKTVSVLFSFVLLSTLISKEDTIVLDT